MLTYGLWPFYTTAALSSGVREPAGCVQAQPFAPVAPHGSCLMATTPVGPGQVEDERPAVPQHQAEQATHLGRGQWDQLACRRPPYTVSWDHLPSTGRSGGRYIYREEGGE